MITRLAEHLDVPLRERNVLLLSGGSAPQYPASDLSDPPMAAVNEPIEHVLRAHEPFPAVVIDGLWEMIAANDAVPVLIEGAVASLLEPPVNVLRIAVGACHRVVLPGRFGDRCGPDSPLSRWRGVRGQVNDELCRAGP
jgi:MmyB-like transcription regulator ligand binding domain